MIYKKLTRSSGCLAGCSGTWPSVTTRSWRNTNVGSTNIGSTSAPRSAWWSRVWNGPLCNPSGRPRGRRPNYRLGNYFGLREQGSRQRARELDIGRILYLAVAVMSFWVWKTNKTVKIRISDNPMITFDIAYSLWGLQFLNHCSFVSTRFQPGRILSLSSHQDVTLTHFLDFSPTTEPAVVHSSDFVLLFFWRILEKLAPSMLTQQAMEWIEFASYLNNNGAESLTDRSDHLS